MSQTTQGDTQSDAPADDGATELAVAFVQQLQPMLAAVYRSSSVPPTLPSLLSLPSTAFTHGLPHPTERHPIVVGSSTPCAELPPHLYTSTYGGIEAALWHVRKAAIDAGFCVSVRTSSIPKQRATFVCSYGLTNAYIPQKKSTKDLDKPCTWRVTVKPRSSARGLAPSLEENHELTLVDAPLVSRNGDTSNECPLSKDTPVHVTLQDGHHTHPWRSPAALPVARRFTRDELLEHMLEQHAIGTPAPVILREIQQKGAHGDLRDLYNFFSTAQARQIANQTPTEAAIRLIEGSNDVVASWLDEREADRDKSRACGLIAWPL